MVYDVADAPFVTDDLDGPSAQQTATDREKRNGHFFCGDLGTENAITLVGKWSTAK